MDLLISFIFGAKLSYERPVEIDPIREQMILLAFCESSNNPKAINYNDGGSPSYGKYQYKMGTAQDFAKAYDYPVEVTEDNILDEQLQDTLTYRALKDGQYRHWYNCSKKYGWI